MSNTVNADTTNVIKFPLTIYYKISEGCQRQLILSGQSAEALRSVTGEISLIEGEALGFKIRHDGKLNSNEASIYHSNVLVPLDKRNPYTDSCRLLGGLVTFELQWFDHLLSFQEALAHAIDFHANRLLMLDSLKRAEISRLENALIEVIGDPQSLKIEDHGFVDQPAVSVHVDQDLLNATRLVLKKRLDEKERQVLEAQAKIDRQAKELAANKVLQLSEWLLKHGDENMIQRNKLGLLDMDEVSFLIEREAFSPVDPEKWAIFRQLTYADIGCECDDYEERCSVEFSSKLDCYINSAQFEDFLLMQKLLPNAKIRTKEHQAKRVDCGATSFKYALVVTLQVGLFEFTREYAI